MGRGGGIGVAGGAGAFTAEFASETLYLYVDLNKRKDCFSQ